MTQAMNAHVSNPFLFAAAKVNADFAALVGFRDAAIPSVFSKAGGPQILYAVILRVSVNVVNVARLLPGAHLEDDPMLKVKNSINSNCSVTVFTEAPSQSASAHVLARFNLPKKRAVTIVQLFAKLF
jgi:hypothetical protein